MPEVLTRVSSISVRISIINLTNVRGFFVVTLVSIARVSINNQCVSTESINIQ
jgi:hypothetical protein